ncbi:MAG: hypothetical protein Q9217_004145 [Psora testacea]
MSSNPALSLPISKSAYTPAQIPSPSQSQSVPSPATESHGQRRAGGLGNFGAGSIARSTSSTPRNNQSLRKQHKGQRRARLADEDAAAESAAMQSTSSRKGRTSITHLMNFTLPPRPQYHPQHNFGRNARRNPAWGLGSGYHAVDKARYIHANYRFIVTPNGDYRAQAVDADVHLDWGNVLQILVSAQSQASNCPICLSTPVAPRMAKCGHIFCLPCLIRYMHSTDGTAPIPEKRARWKKCPICYDSIYISETRPVRWFTGQEGERPQEGDDVVLRLIMRRPGSTLALPRGGAENLYNTDDIPWYFAAEVMDYARIMKGSEDYMTEQYNEEVEELRQQEKEDELIFGEDAQWTKKAVSSVHEAVERVKGIGNPPTAPKQPGERNPRRLPAEYCTNTDNVPEHHGLQHAYKVGQSPPRVSISPYERSGSAANVQRRHSSLRPSGDNAAETVTSTTSDHIESLHSLSAAASTPDTKSMISSYSRDQSIATLHNVQSDSPFFFYEALLHFYLSPLDIRILKLAFGDYPSFPTTILPRVERVSTGHIVDDELRRRAKYLAHLPQGCEVAFLECNWTDVVSSDILKGFAPEIERRRKKNQEKDILEEKERARAEKEEDDKRWASARRKRPSLSHNIGSETEFQPLPETSAVDFALASSSPPWSSSRCQQGSAFASLASPSTSPVTTKTVWGTRVVAPSTPPMPAINQHNDMLENDGWLQDWESNLLREEELIAQVENTSLEPGSSKHAATSTTNKKKKGKKITLMSTNARRGA